MDQQALLKVIGNAITMASTMAPDQIERLMKDAMPSGGRPSTGYLYDGGPFSSTNPDVYALNIGQSSEFSRWLPSQRVNWMKDEVQHLSLAGLPYGFNGEDTYADYLSSFTIPTCGYGPAGTNWDGFRYQVDGGGFSFTTDMMTVIEDSGLQYYQRQPIQYNIHGGFGATNGVITNDKDWAIAQLLDKARQHVDYINLYGEKVNSDMEWDGISSIIAPGYVQEHLIGVSAEAKLADPMWVNGISLGVPTDAALLLKTLNAVVTNRLNYIRARGWTMNIASDCALLMHPTVLEMLHQAQAAGGDVYWANYFDTPGQILQTLDGYRAEYNRLKESRTLRLGGVDIPVITDVNLGFYGSVTVGSTPTQAYTGDVFFLVKRLNGMNILEQRYIDWSKMDYPFKGSERMDEINGGTARTGWVEEANKCYYYYLEMFGRIVCLFMPVQARISNVTIIPNTAYDLPEQTAYWAPNYSGWGKDADGNYNRGGGGERFFYGQRS